MQTILVTGGTGGLGQVVIPRLLEQNYNVISVSKDGDDVFETKIHDLITKTSLQSKAIFIHSDLTAITDKTNSLLDFSKIDHLLLMHAKNYIYPIMELPIEMLLDALMVNFVSSYAVARECIKSWLTNKTQADHSITFISSVAVKGGAPDELAYHSSKRAMEAAILSFARQYSGLKIRSNIISPGLMDTPMGKKSLEARPDILDRIPGKALTKTSDIANAILFCINTTSITGETLHINQGRYFDI